MCKKNIEQMRPMEPRDLRASGATRLGSERVTNQRRPANNMAPGTSRRGPRHWVRVLPSTVERLTATISQSKVEAGLSRSPNPIRIPSMLGTTTAAAHDDSSFAQLNAVLQARGYISRPIDFGELDDDHDHDHDHNHDHDHDHDDNGKLSSNVAGDDKPGGSSNNTNNKQPRSTRKRKHAVRIRMAGFADIIQLILSDTARDLEAKTTLSARVRQLEASLTRQEKAFRLQGEELIAAQRQASSAQAQVE